MLLFFEDFDLPEDERIPWVLVYTTNTLIDAEMFRANLEGADIPVQVLSQVDSTRMFSVGELAIVKIFVQSPYYEQAKEIINHIESNEYNDDGIEVRY
ncbi:MAG: DUF2007 domain-containing protein [Candidatus Kapabacteria bacterium]|nr:DUF2007 domain-containing protein [Candidatus Kapabacteria bacterium]